MRVLIVEDEFFLAEASRAGLRHEAIVADFALGGSAALDRFAANDYDAITPDRDIPGTHSTETASRCRPCARPTTNPA